MVSHIVILLSSAFCLVEPTLPTLSRNAVRNTILDNTYKTTNQIWNNKQLSKTRCLAFCLKIIDCRSFAYNSVTQRCQGFNRDFRGQTVTGGVTEEGTLHYDLLDGEMYGPFANAPAADCADVQSQGYTCSGVYTITIAGVQKQVWCDLQTDGGRWTVIQRRKDGSINFDVGWNEYKNGFGIPSQEYWIGNEALFALSSSNTMELIILMERWNGVWVHVRYSSFRVNDGIDKYRLNLSGYTATAGLGDSLAMNNGMPFSTKDQDNDPWAGSCNPAYHTGGWWYDACTYSALNGLHYNSPAIDTKSCHWSGLTGQRESLKTVFMMIRKY